MNRAIHGDVVVVEVFDEKEWKAPADEVIDQSSRFSFRYRMSIYSTHGQQLYAMTMLKTQERKEMTMMTMRLPAKRKLP
jgi:exoribonuclease R